jgi:uncharacterized RDD family membrane protein YckC
MEYTYAGLWARTKAFALDYLIIAGYLALVFAMSFRVPPTVTQRLFTNPISGQLVGFLLVTLPVTLYFALLESSSWQATWGKRKLGLRLIRTDGARLSFARALGRTLLKFVPWELAHTCVWQLQFQPEGSSPLIYAGLGLVWLLVGANIASLLRSRTHQTLYDRLASTYVIAAPNS